MRNARLLGIFATILFVASGLMAQATDYRDIKTPPLRSFSMPQPARIQLANGMVIFLQEDHELPLIQGSATIRGGARDVAADRAGLTGIYTQAWRTGGTATKSGDELDEFLDARAARVETGGDTDSTSVSLDVLKGDFDTVFPIFVDLLRNPAFRQEKIDLAKTQANTMISRRNDEPGGILARETTKLAYGVNSPYARQSEYATIASITRDDLLAFHKKTVHPNNIILSLIGDFDAKKMEKKLRDTFGSWPKGPQISKPDPAMTPAGPGVYFVAKDDVTQANIAMFHQGIERNNPDYYALAVMNDILSGGFSGRLMKSLRSEKGLTYGVGGGVGANWDYPGLFRLQMATKSGTALESIEALKKEATRLVTDPVTAEELSLAKDSILNAFVFTMDTREKALNQQVLLEFYGFPSDYFTKYPAMIEAVTADDVARVAKKYVHPDQLTVLVVGKEADFDKPLSTLGKVNTIDITIPEADAGQKKPAATASSAEGIALAEKVAAFAGGKANIAAVKTLERSGTMKMVTPQGEMEAEYRSTSRLPDAQRFEMKMAMGEITRVVTPEVAFVVMPMGSQDLPSSQRDQGLSEMRSEMLNVLQNIGNAAYTFNAAGTEKVGDIDAAVLEIGVAGSTVKWHIDPATGRLLQSVTRAGAPMPGDVVTQYAEWKTFGTIQLPTVATVMRDGKMAAQMMLVDAKVNPTVAPTAFSKPAAPAQ